MGWMGCKTISEQLHRHSGSQIGLVYPMPPSNRYYSHNWEGDPEVRFMRNYIRQRLEDYESLEFSQHPRQRLLEIGQEASSIRKYIFDARDEGYHHFTDAIVRPIDAMARLDRFLGRLVHSLGAPSERHLFHLYPQEIDLAILHASKFDGEKIKLNVLLEGLEQQTETATDVQGCFADPRQEKHWIAKTAILLNETMKFLRWTLDQYRREPAGTVPVFLLRDTLFLYWGYKELYRQGLVTIEPQPLLLSRKFLLYTEGSEDAYMSVISRSIYEALAEQPKDAESFRRLFNHFLQNKALPISFQRETRAYLEQLVGLQPIFMVESGLAGSMPLWIMSQCENDGKFVMYTTAPWLEQLYGANIFCRNYNYLRDIETSVAQEFLFQFHSVENGQCWVRKTSNPLIEKLALFELQRFRELLASA